MTGARSKSGRAAWLTATALVFVSVAATLAVSEIAIRVFWPQRLYYNVSRWDPDVGFVEIPNIQSVQRNDEYRMTIRINSRGLRDREFPFEKPPNTFRIGVFGDSFTFGEGVESEQTYAKLLERSFANDPQFAATGSRVEVLNFGIGKTGTSHQLAWYRKEGVRYHLDIVIVAFLSYNDFNDNLKGVFRLASSGLVHDPAGYSSVRRIQSVLYHIPGYRWLSEHSQLVNVARVAGTMLDERGRQAKAADLAKTDSGRDAYAVELTRRLIETFAAEARANGSKLLLLSLPVVGQRQLSDYEATGRTPPAYTINLAQLQDSLKSSQIEWIDLVSEFAALPDEATYYYEANRHWRPAGHKVAARLLYHRLAGEIHALATAR